MSAVFRPPVRANCEIVAGTHAANISLAITAVCERRILNYSRRFIPSAPLPKIGRHRVHVLRARVLGTRKTLYGNARRQYVSPFLEKSPAGSPRRRMCGKNYACKAQKSPVATITITIARRAGVLHS